MSNIYILRKDDRYDGYGSDADIATFDNEDSALSYQAAYEIVNPTTATVIVSESIISGKQEFTPLYHYSVMVPTVGNSRRIGDNQIVKTNKSGLTIERVISKDAHLISSGISITDRHVSTRLTPEGPVHNRERVLLIESYGRTEEDVTNWVHEVIAQLRVTEKEIAAEEAEAIRNAG